MSILGRKSKCFNSGLREKLEDIKGSNRQWIMKRPFNFFWGGGGDVGVWSFSNSVSKFYIKISWHERSKNQLFCTTVLNKSLGKIWEKKNDLWCTKINWILFRLKIKSEIQRKKHSSSHIQVKWSVLYNSLLQITYLLSLEQQSEHMET